MPRLKSPSHLLKTTLYCYNNNTSNCAGATVEFPITQETVSTTPVNGTTRKSAYTFDIYGNTLTDAEYDYGASGPTTTTTTVYGSWDTSNSKCVAVSATINNRPCTVVTVSGGNTLAQAHFSYDAYGNLTTKSTWTGSTWLTSTATYNGNGTVATSYDAANNLTTYDYNGSGGCNGVFPTSVSVGGLTTYYTWNCTGGVLLTRSNPNNSGIVTTYGYENSSDAADPFWRVSSVTDPLNNETWITYTPNSVEAALTFGSSTNDVTRIVDGYGRPSRTQVKQAPGATQYDTVSTQYGWSGNYRSVATTVPCTVASGSDCSFSSGVTTGLFDPVGRWNSTTDGGSGTITNAYSLNDALTVLGPAPTNEHTKNRQLEYDGLGRLTSVCEILNSGGTSCGQKTTASGYTTSYAYSVPSSGVSQVVVTQGSQTRTYKYDALGRLTYESNPESGTTSYAYDAPTSNCTNSAWNGYMPGTLVQKQDANGNVICYFHDGLGRIVTISAHAGPNAWKVCERFSYDNTNGTVGQGPPSGATLTNLAGHLAEAETDDCAWPVKSTDIFTDEWFGYSPRGEPTDLFESTPSSGGYSHVTQSYWPHGVVASLGGIPGVPTITYGVDGEGRWNSVSASSGPNPVQTNGVVYTALGPTSVLYGSGDSDAFTYDPNTGREASYSFKVGTTGQSMTGSLYWNQNRTLQKLWTLDSYNSANNNVSVVFGYDDLGRVASDSNVNGGGNWSQTFTYDAFGNITKSGTISWMPGYNSSSNHYASPATYDNNGNLTNNGSVPATTYAWDMENRMVNLNGTGMVVTYDAFGRMAEENFSNGGLIQTFLYSPAGAQLAELRNGQSTNLAWIPLPGGGTAVYQYGALSYYQHKDHLGTSRLASLPGQTVEYDKSFAAFGEDYNDLNNTQNWDWVFAGMNATAAGSTQNSVNLYDALRREYSPIQGRWISPDPAGLGAVDMTNPQTWNRYAYVANNPLSYIDPHGTNLMHPCSGPQCNNGDTNNPFDPTGGGGVFGSALGGMLFNATQYDFSGGLNFQWDNFGLSDLLTFADQGEISLDAVTSLGVFGFGGSDQGGDPFANGGTGVLSRKAQQCLNKVQAAAQNALGQPVSYIGPTQGSGLDSNGFRNGAYNFDFFGAGYTGGGAFNICGRYVPGGIIGTITGIGPSLHIVSPPGGCNPAGDPTSYLMGQTPYGSGFLFTAHIDSAFGFNPLGFIWHEIVDVLLKRNHGC